MAGANLSATPFATWAGDVSVALGAEWREESIRGSVPQQYQPIINGTRNGVAISTTNPVGRTLPADKWPLQRQGSLSRDGRAAGPRPRVQGAVRETDYSTSGYVTTWKLGATWQPIKDIRSA